MKTIAAKVSIMLLDVPNSIPDVFSFVLIIAALLSRREV
jgi:hypothetical protein